MSNTLTKTQFVAALPQSTNTYKTQHQLYRNFGAHCCLGVAVDVCNPGFFPSGFFDTASAPKSSLVRLVRDYGVGYWAGKFSMPPWRACLERDVTLYELNDDAGLTFSQIADMVEHFFNEDMSPRIVYKTV